MYQGRFKSFPVQDDEHFFTVCRYVERNALRAKLVKRAEDWRWGSLWRWLQKSEPEPSLLSTWRIPRQPHWVERVNEPLTSDELAAIRTSVKRGSPYGEASWIASSAKCLGLESTLRPRGRPQVRFPTQRHNKESYPDFFNKESPLILLDPFDSARSIRRCRHGSSRSILPSR